MGKKRRKMIDTSIPEDEVELRSRTKERKELKEHQARLEVLALRLASLTVERRARFELEEIVEKEVVVLSGIKKGSGLARQRRRVAKLLRLLDLDALEAKLDTLSRKPGRSANH